MQIVNGSAATCPVCAYVGCTVYLDASKNVVVPSMVGSFRSNARPGRILRCRNCRLGFAEYRPTDDELARWYQQMDTHLYEMEQAGRMQTAETHLRIVQRYITRPGRLLDVGCASGLFLQCAMAAGWNVSGVELSAELCRTAQQRLGSKAVLYCSALQDAPFPFSFFDAVTLWDVLEHVRDPVQFMSRCAALLKPSGYVFANVPNLDSVQSRVLGSRWPLLLPEHLSYFTRESLRQCGGKAGLEWVGLYRRSAVFSADYILYRLGQHRLPGSKLARRILRRIGLATWFIPLRMGEICGIWRRPAA